MTTLVLVARVNADTTEYLGAGIHGLTEWVSDVSRAATFETLREATRQAMRLPSRLRAFALPTTDGAERMRTA
jgi:hypothetical protein